MSQPLSDPDVPEKWPKKRRVPRSSAPHSNTSAPDDTKYALNGKQYAPDDTKYAPGGKNSVLDEKDLLTENRNRNQSAEKEGGTTNVSNSIDDMAGFCRPAGAHDEPCDYKRKTVTDERKSTCTCLFPTRYILVFLLCSGMLFIYFMRTNVGVTVIMLLDTNAQEKVKVIQPLTKASAVRWNSRHIGFLHSAFYIGYLISQLPGAYLTTVFPSHRLFGLAILISALLNLLVPVCIEQGLYGFLCTLRCCQGIAETNYIFGIRQRTLGYSFKCDCALKGLLYPASYGVMRHWTAPSERSVQVSGVLTSGYAGAIVGFTFGGLITHFIGWQYMYYVSGSACIVWFLFWLCLAYEKPSHHKGICVAEFEYMEKQQGQDVIDYENFSLPWKSILTSLPVLAVCLCHFARYWVFILMLTNEPLYLNEFGFSVAETGMYSSLPHVIKVILSFASGIMADFLLNAGYLSTTAVRKLMTGVGYSTLALCLIVLTFLNDGTSVIITLMVALGGFGLTTSGWAVNHYDLSTRHASSLVAVTSTFGTLGAISVPLAVGALTVDQELYEWNRVFYLTAGIILFAEVFYLIFASGNPQPWATPPSHLELVPRFDPLVRMPYQLVQVQSQVGFLGAADTGEKHGLVPSPITPGYTAAIPGYAVDVAQQDKQSSTIPADGQIRVDETCVY